MTFRSRPIRNTAIFFAGLLALFVAAAIGFLAGHAVGHSGMQAAALRSQTLLWEENKRLKDMLRELQKSE